MESVMVIKSTYYIIVISALLSVVSSFALFLALHAVSRYSFAGYQRFVFSVSSVVLSADANLSGTQGILPVCYPTELREYYQEPPRSQGH